jgi:hypothetical protein
MKAKVLLFCAGCVLVLAVTGTASAQTEAPAILSALGNQSGVTIVGEADLAQIEGTGPLAFWSYQWRAHMRAFFQASMAMRRNMIRARIAFWRNGGWGYPGGETGGDTGGGGEIPPE